MILCSGIVCGGRSIETSKGTLLAHVSLFTTVCRSKAGCLEFNMSSLQSSQERLLLLVSELQYGLSGLSLHPTPALYWYTEGLIYIFGS